MALSSTSIRGILEGDAVAPLPHEATGGHRGTGRVEPLLLGEGGGTGEAATGEEAAQAQPAADVLELKVKDRQVGLPWTDERRAASDLGHDGCGAADLQLCDAGQP